MHAPLLPDEPLDGQAFLYWIGNMFIHDGPRVGNMSGNRRRGLAVKGMVSHDLAAPARGGFFGRGRDGSGPCQPNCGLARRHCRGARQEDITAMRTSLTWPKVAPLRAEPVGQSGAKKATFTRRGTNSLWRANMVGPALNEAPPLRENREP